MFTHVIIKEKPNGMAHKVARAIQKKIIENNRLGKPTVLGLATGSTPEPLYRELIRMHREENLDFSRVITFNLDEYIGLASDHKQSYSYYMHQNFFNHVNIKPEHIHLLNGTLPLEVIPTLAAQFERLIEEAGGIDIQLLGIGVNGHIGFNEPGSALDSKTRLVQLDQKTIQANSRFFGPDETVPSQAFTMGIGTILKYCKSCYLLASGDAKADIIAQLVASETADITIPATALHLHQQVIIVLDEKAAAKLPKSNKSIDALFTSGFLAYSGKSHKNSEAESLIHSPAQQDPTMSLV